MAQLFVPPFLVITDANGSPISGGQVQFYLTGTTTPAAIYTTDALSVEHSNPVEADSAGRLSAVYLDPDVTYRAVVKDASGTTIRDIDPINDTLSALLSATTGATLVGFLDRTVGSRLADTLHILDYIPVAQHAALKAGTSAYDITADLLEAINEFRTADRLKAITDPTFGATNCYRGGEIVFPDGVYPCSFDQLEITDILGLTFRGQGQRGATNYQRGSTELVFSGTSTGYGIRAKGSGARNFQLKDMSVTYSGDDFTGTLIDLWNAPGSYLENCYIGHDGLAAIDRKTTASALVQLTGDEFFRTPNCGFSGAARGIYFYTERSGSSFGGSATDLSGAFFYDFTESMVESDGVYTHLGLDLSGCAFDPITVQPKRAVLLRNMKNVVIDGAVFVGASASFHPSVEWMTLYNVTGEVRASTFSTGTPAGTLNGRLTLTTNYDQNTTGPAFRLLGGTIIGYANDIGDSDIGFDIWPSLTITGAANNGVGLIRVTSAEHRLATGMGVTISGVVGTTEANGSWTVTEIDEDTFDLQGSTFANAWVSGGTIVSSDSLVFELGPDVFTNVVTQSYVCSQNNTNVSGVIRYHAGKDGSASKLSNANTRVAIRNVDERTSAQSADFTASNFDSGRTYELTKTGSTQAVTLPTPMPGVVLKFLKTTTQQVTITCGGATVLYTGETATKTIATGAATAVGAYLEIESYGTTGWRVKGQNTGWTFS